MENGHKWSWSVLVNAHKKVVGSHGKPLLLFCMHLEVSLIISQHKKPVPDFKDTNLHYRYKT